MTCAPQDFDLSFVLELLSMSLLFFPLIESTLAAGRKLEDSPRDAIMIIVTGGAINIFLAAAVYAVVFLIRLI